MRARRRTGSREWFCFCGGFFLVAGSCQLSTCFWTQLRKWFFLAFYGRFTLRWRPVMRDVVVFQSWSCCSPFCIYHCRVLHDTLPCQAMALHQKLLDQARVEVTEENPEAQEKFRLGHRDIMLKHMLPSLDAQQCISIHNSLATTRYGSTQGLIEHSKSKKTTHYSIDSTTFSCPRTLS